MPFLGQLFCVQVTHNELIDNRAAKVAGKGKVIHTSEHTDQILSVVLQAEAARRLAVYRYPANQGICVMPKNKPRAVPLAIALT